MKIAIKQENYEFLVIFLRTCIGSYRPCKSNWNQELWAITHKNGHKQEKHEFLGITLKHVSGLKVIVNRPRTPKLWAIAQENSHKTRERRVSGHIYQTYQGSFETCKSA